MGTDFGPPWGPKNLLQSHPVSVCYIDTLFLRKITRRLNGSLILASPRHSKKTHFSIPKSCGNRYFTKPHLRQQFATISNLKMMLFAFQDGPAVGSKFHVQTQTSGSGAKRRSRASWESLRGSRKPSRNLPRRHGKRPRCLATGPKRQRTKLSEFCWGHAAHEDEVAMHVCSWQ